MNLSSTFHPRRRALVATLVGAAVGVQCAASAVALFFGGLHMARNDGPRRQTGSPSPSDGPAFYDLSREAAQLLWDGEQAAIATCMRGRGLEYTPAVFLDRDDYRYAPSTPRDLVALRRDGYGVAGHTGSSPDRSPPVSSANADGGPWQFADALLGPDLPDAAEPPGPGWERVELPAGASMYWFSDSCVARGFREIYGPLHPHDEIPLALERWRSSVSAALAADISYRTALSDWRGCMSERGYTFEAPGAARQLLESAAAAAQMKAEKMNLEQWRADELAIAGADVACDAEVELDARARDARRRAALAVPSMGSGWQTLESELSTAREHARHAVSAGTPKPVASLDAPSAS